MNRAKRGPYTPRSGPLAGIQYSSYYRYQVARARYQRERPPCQVCGGMDGEHNWETHTLEMRADALSAMEPHDYVDSDWDREGNY